MGRVRKTLVTAGALLFIVCMLGALAFSQATTLMVANEWIVYSLLGLLLLLIVLWPAARANIFKQKGKAFAWFVVIGSSITGLAFFTLFGWHFVGDFLRERQHIQGMLGPKPVKSGRFGVPSYYLHLNGRDYETTAEVYKSAGSRGYSRAEIGAGSNTIFKIEPVPFPENAPPIQQYSFP
jgi:hypothetical protein